MTGITDRPPLVVCPGWPKCGNPCGHERPHMYDSWGCCLDGCNYKTATGKARCPVCVPVKRKAAKKRLDNAGGVG